MSNEFNEWWKSHYKKYLKDKTCENDEHIKYVAEKAWQYGYGEGKSEARADDLGNATSVILAAMCANPALVEVGYSEKVKQAKMQAMVLLKELER